MYKKITIFIFILLFFLPRLALAKDTFPKLANPYLATFGKSDWESLSKWDLLIVQQEMQFYNPGFYDYYKKKNKDGLLFAYVYPAMIDDTLQYENVGLRSYVYDNIAANDWLLKDGNGNPIDCWPNIGTVNVTDSGWQNFVVNYLKTKIDLNKWDGVMYDIVDSSISHYSKNGIDINNDGRAESPAVVNNDWDQGMADLFAKTRKALPNKLIIINGSSLSEYQPNINGRVFETFPTPWEGDGSWTASMKSYLQVLPKENQKPVVYVINSNTNNTGRMDDYQKMRFGLASALLGDGYFSFDSGDANHSQLWWYDEYDVKLGHAESSYYNLLDKGDNTIKSGLWRRDFENGVSLVNSTNKPVLYSFNKEEFEKIKGTQDRLVNDGSKVNYIRLAPRDGVILLKINTEIKDSSFMNGAFARVFSASGDQTRNGFFTYKDDLPPGANVITSDLNCDGRLEKIVSDQGAVSIFADGKTLAKFYPYTKNFKGKISLATANFNRNCEKEIVTGVGSSGGPLVKIFNYRGKLISGGFFTFTKKFRGGINLAAGDVNGDGMDEIIVAPAGGYAPEVKIFDDRGNLLNGFFAYDKNFGGGVSVAAGDVNGDGMDEIITGPGQGGGPLVKIFRNSTFLNKFFAYDESSRTGISVMTSDIDGDGKNEIMVSENGQ